MKNKIVSECIDAIRIGTGLCLLAFGLGGMARFGARYADWCIDTWNGNY